jgi:hypothetical protein
MDHQTKKSPNCSGAIDETSTDEEGIADDDAVMAIARALFIFFQRSGSSRNTHKLSHELSATT